MTTEINEHYFKFHLADSSVLIMYRLFSQALVRGTCPLCCLNQSDGKLKALLLNPDFKWRIQIAILK